MKPKTVLLQAGKKQQEFSFEHAEAILKSATNMDARGKALWTVPKDSKFEFIDNELRTKSNKGSGKQSGA